jgi:hypothetical protein
MTSTRVSHTRDEQPLAASGYITKLEGEGSKRDQIATQLKLKETQITRMATQRIHESPSHHCSKHDVAHLLQGTGERAHRKDHEDGVKDEPFDTVPHATIG